jgi:hypothetical protein
VAAASLPHPLIVHVAVNGEEEKAKRKIPSSRKKVCYNPLMKIHTIY